MIRKIVTIFRFVCYIGILYLVYGETGFWTVFTLGFITLAMELQGFQLPKTLKEIKEAIDEWDD